MKGLLEKFDEHIVLDYKFMDTKNINTDESQQLFYEQIKYYLQSVPEYDIIIAGDDDAFEFAMDYQQELFNEIPIIFLGVNRVDLTIPEKDNPYVTGIIESLSFEDTINLAYQIYPQANEVVAILDDTATGKGGRAEFYKNEKLFPELDFKEINASELSQKELVESVASLDDESILLFIVCGEDGDGNVYASAESVTILSENSKIPMFAVMLIGLEKGILGGKIVSHKLMGNMAADMAIKILNGTPCSDILWIDEPPMTYWFDENVMKHFGISDKWIPEGAEIANHEETFWERNQSMIRISLVVGTLLVALIIMLARDNVRSKKMNLVVKEANEKLECMVRYDALTGIRNRRTFEEDLNQMIVEGQPFGIIMYDLDNFKKINDIYGHNAGDCSLKEFAKRSDEFTDKYFTVYRFAGDEFIAIVQSNDRKKVENYMKYLHNAMQKPFSLGDTSKVVSTSIGAAMWPDDGKTSEEIVAAADMAMYYVKNNGKNGMKFYEKSIEKNKYEA